jgi:hypothetical protein
MWTIDLDVSVVTNLQVSSRTRFEKWKNHCEDSWYAGQVGLAAHWRMCIVLAIMSILPALSVLY